RGGYTVVNQVSPYKETFFGENIIEYLHYFKHYIDNANIPPEKCAMTLKTLTIKSLEAKKNLKEIFIAEDNTAINSPKARLKKLNQKRLPNDYPQTIRWLTCYQFKFKKLKKEYKLITI
ncbi:unnamed protein product, partial [Fusarium fujikuroi]